MRRKLTDDVVAALPTKRKRYIVYDTQVPGLGVRVGKRRKKFVLVGRLTGNHATRHTLGPVSALSVAQARLKALNYQRPSNTTFGDIAEQFVTRISHQRRARDVERYIRRELLPRWRQRSISEITKRDVVDAIESVTRRGKRAAAHHVLSTARLIFNYAVDREYIEHSPCDRLKPKTLIGRKIVRSRILDEEEIFAFYTAATAIPYPYGQCLLLLLMTAQRKNEIAHARWSEIKDGVLIIPPERFKSDSVHRVPLPRLALDIIDQLPRQNEYLFGHPLRGFGKAKKRLLRRCRQRHVIHDLRRTVRTQLSALGVSSEVGEFILGHGKRGIERVYNVHRYEREMREALEFWCQHLSAIDSKKDKGQ